MTTRKAAAVAAGSSFLCALHARAAESRVVLAVPQEWCKLALAPVQRTPTSSPPVESRSLAYLGVTAFEVVASGDKGLRSLSGQANGLRETPRGEPGQTYDEALVKDGALGDPMQNLFGDTGPTGPMYTR